MDKVFFNVAIRALTGVLVLGSVGFCASPLRSRYDALLKRYERQIAVQEKRLETVRIHLDEKTKETDRWDKLAEQSKQECAQARRAMEEARAKARSFQTRSQDSHARAESAQWTVLEKETLRQNADEQRRLLHVEIYKDQCTTGISQNPNASDRLRRAALERLTLLSLQARGQSHQARQEELTFRMEALHWQEETARYQEQADHFRRTQQQNYDRWQEALKRQTALEDEKAQLDQSAQVLHVLLEDLRRNRDETRDAKLETESLTHGPSIAKGSLPWPVSGEVTQRFGRQQGADLHQLLISNGVKITAVPGQIVHSVEAGKVLFAGPFQSYGPLVIVQHKHGLHSVYGGLGTTDVKEGQVLTALEKIGTLGTSGSFYFELRHHEQPINPLVWMAPAHTSEISLRRKFQ